MLVRAGCQTVCQQSKAWFCLLSILSMEASPQRAQSSTLGSLSAVSQVHLN